MKYSNKLVCLVLEGMDRRLLNKFIEKGYLKNIKKLITRQGGSLISTKVPYEGAALQTAFTGYSPEESGVFSYWHIHNYDYTPQIIDSSELIKPAIWQRKELADKKFAVINVFGTEKPYEINGYMISYLFQQSLHGCYPKNLIRDLSIHGYPYGNDVSVLYTGTSREKFLNMLFKVEKNRVNVSLELLKRVDILIANFTIIDRVSHFYTQELDSDVFNNVTDTAIYKAYKMMDETVAKFIQVLDSGCDILIFSELGFGKLREFVSFNDYLNRKGFLKYKNNGEVDQKHSVAFESIQGSHGININLKGLYRNGCVTLEDFEPVRTEIIDYLKHLINPKTGLLFFKEVVKGEEYYKGPCYTDAPHIMLEPLDYRYLPLGDNYWANHLFRHFQSGWHRREGFWTGTGTNVSGVKKDGSILDICPTLFQLAGKEIPNEFKGNSLIQR